MPRFTRRRVLLALFGLVALALAFAYPAWRRASDIGGQQPAEPFRIAGNFYYVGANDVAAFLITSPQGHVLLDGGYPGTPPLILASIRKLGFDVRDVKVLINSEPHHDHAGGLAELQKASGAQLWVSAASADAMQAGGVDPDAVFPVRVVAWLVRYPVPRIDRRIADGDTVRVGSTTLVAHLTPGHTRGCTSWSFPVQDGGRELHVVSACSLVKLGMVGYPEQRADFERSVRVLRALPADIWVSSHARLWGRYRKFAARDTAKDPVAPFIDREGYRAYLDSGLARIRRGEEH